MSEYRGRAGHDLSRLGFGLACGTVFGVAGIVETLVIRVRLTDDALLVTGLRGRRSYPKAGIAGVEEAKGSPPFLLLKEGRPVKLHSG